MSEKKSKNYNNLRKVVNLTVLPLEQKLCQDITCNNKFGDFFEKSQEK